MVKPETQNKILYVKLICLTCGTRFEVSVLPGPICPTCENEDCQDLKVAENQTEGNTYNTCPRCGSAPNKYDETCPECDNRASVDTQGETK